MSEANSEDFLLTLFNMNYSEDVTQGVTQDVTQDDVGKKIRKMIKNNPNVSTEEMPDVQYVGSGYSGHWEIKAEE